MFIRCLLTLAIAAGFCSAEILSFKDVKFEYISKENGKTTKADGMLHLDKEARIVSFSSENRVLCNIRYEDIDSATYHEDPKMLEVRFTTNGAGDFAKFKLDGGNRKDILSYMEAQSKKSISRTKN